MKPWRPYWKTIEAALDGLLEKMDDPLFSDMSKVRHWIESLNFIELMIADENALSITVDLHKDPSKKPYIYNSGIADKNRHLHQLILRYECAYSFCRGEVGERKQFDWSESPEDIFKYLLIDFWRSNAIHWAHRRLPAPKNYHAKDPISPWQKQLIAKPGKN